MSFLGDLYLLGNETAVKLYEATKDLPIIDAHNHANVKEIWENQNYTDIWQVEAATDHYTWEVMRKRGVAERFITGDATNKEKWLALANIFEELVGNPTYDWIHLDIKRTLGIDTPINAHTGEQIWDEAQRKLSAPDMKPQALLKKANVKWMCSTDDPIDSLEYHQKLKDSELGDMIRPTYRPDKAMNIFKPDWKSYITKLEERTNMTFDSIADLCKALRITHDYFAKNGCIASDHGVEIPYGYQVPEEDANTAFRKAYANEPLSQKETVAYMSYVLNEVAELDAEKGWVFQLHIGAVRDIRDSLANQIGPDSGGDVSNHGLYFLDAMNPLLNRFDNRLKVVFYCLDPNHQTTLAAVSRAYGEKINLGSAWWLNDSPIGMKRQLEYIGSVDVLMNFAGMVSDSRKILSYQSRNEMFRRVLCDVIGNMVEMQQIPLHLAEKLVIHLSYERPKELFGFGE